MEVSTDTDASAVMQDYGDTKDKLIYLPNSPGRDACEQLAGERMGGSRKRSNLFRTRLSRCAPNQAPRFQSPMLLRVNQVL
jgi:hypothetical protein